MSKNKHGNRLIRETSPYLLQHAHNPVDWYPWGDDALAAARATGKPILLSIGYSACHWCHVMAHESFEDEAIAKIMNTHFINIKVDREERPDLDQIYQQAVQCFIKQGGGWPLTMFLTPEKIPFHGGTYFPPEDRYRLPAFPKVLLAVAEAYRERPQDITRTAKNVLNTLQRIKRDPSKKTINANLLRSAVEKLGKIFDVANGGFGGAPKFPSTPALTLFLHHYQESGEKRYLEMLTHSLKKMARGGLYDQFGGGFHRYSTDAAWQVPHFEKMLYDNAQLARLYFSSYQATQDPFFRRIGIETLEYVLREMTDVQGGFYAAQDADSEGGEGSFYTWSPEEIRAVLDADTAKIVCRHYEIRETGNFEGKTIPHREHSLNRLADETGASIAAVAEVLRVAKTKLYAQREKRPKPLRDEKIMTGWNSLMIGAFVSGYQVTRDKRYLAAAEQAADFIFKHLYKEGTLLHVYKDGVAKFRAYLDDAAFFADALLDLYEAGAGGKYLSPARLFADTLIAGFWDEQQGGFFFTSHEHEVLIDRMRPCFDHSIPSGNAIAAQVLQRLFYLTGKQHYFDKAEQCLLTFAQEMDANPFALGHMIAAADFYLRRPKEIHIIGDPDTPETEALLRKIHQAFLPNKLISFNDTPAQRHWMDKTNTRDGTTAVYICQNFTCSQALTDWEEIQLTLFGSSARS